MAGNRMPLREGVYYNSALSCLESPIGDIHLTPNEKKILEIILAKRGRKETIIEEIWHQQGIVVSESSYHQLVKMIRRKFVAAGMPSSSLKTIPRYGVVYRSNTDVESDNDEEFYDKNLNFSENVSEGRSFYSIDNIKTEELPSKGLVVTNREEFPKREGLSKREQFYKNEELSKNEEFYKNEKVSKSVKVSNSLTILSCTFSSLILIVILFAYDNQEYFHQVKHVGNVNYFVAPTTKVSETLWQRIERQVLPATKETYIASNGPKVWVAYCEKNIYKDNAPCTYEHFSVY